MVLAESLTKSYTRGNVVHALRGVSLSIEAGESLAIMGPSGSGKSTLLNILGGLDTPTSGRAIVAGFDLSTLDEDRRAFVRREHVATVFQMSHMMPTLTCAQNVALPLHLRGLARREIAVLVQRSLEDVGLWDRREHLPDELSGGERQRVAVARALAITPSVILADEPTGNLDSASGDQILALFQRVRQDRRTSVALVTHDAHAAATCDRIFRIRDGLAEPSASETMWS